ncbi:MAG: tetratricopeptide repeat protein [Myxococcota bacterium]|nr:tetratricopeptide repeat protein [Myxococcota bacterium]
MSGLKCRSVEKGLDDYIEQRLDNGEMERFEEHLAVCARCQQTLKLWHGFVHEIRSCDPEALSPLVARRYAIAAISGRKPTPRSIDWKRWAAVSFGAAAVAFSALFYVLVVTDPTAGGDLIVPAEIPHASPSNVNMPGLSTLPAVLGPTQLPDGRRLISATSHTHLWLDPEAVVEVKAITRHSAWFQLISGRVVAEINARIKGYRFVVETPSGSVEAKGTVFSVQVTPGGKESARVIQGVVEVRGRMAQDSVLRQFELRAGQEGRVGANTPQMASIADMKRDMCLMDGCGQDEIAALIREAASGRDIAGETGPTKRFSRAPADHASNTATSRQRLTAPERAKANTDASEAGFAGLDDLLYEDQDAGTEHQDPETLVSMALKERRAGEYRTAAATYRRLIREFPGSSAAQSAMVSLGQLELVELANPGRAESHFSAYLKQVPGGFLKEEARLGRVRTAGYIGGPAAVVKRATEYLTHHPSGYASAEVLRRRANARRKIGDCSAALRDYNALFRQWPGSKQLRLAVEGRADCHNRLIAAEAGAKNLSQ